MPLVLCAACARHRRASDAACPFCSATATEKVGRAAAPRGTRAAIALGGVIVGATAGCFAVSGAYGGPPPAAVPEQPDGAFVITEAGAPGPSEPDR